MRLAYLLAALLLCGCIDEPPAAADRPPGDDERPDDELPPPDSIGDAQIVRADCEPGEDAPRFRLLAEAGRRNTLLGDCGELAWTDPATEALHLAPLDEPPRQVDDDGRPLWLEGDRLLYLRPGEVVLEQTDRQQRTWSVPRAFEGGRIPGEDAFWTCSVERGIERLDEAGVTALSPDFFDTEYGEGCLSIEVAHAGTIAFPTDDFRVGVVDPASGARTTVDLPFYRRGSEDDAERAREDAVRLSPDGSWLLHEKRWMEMLSSDSVGVVSEGELSAVEVADAATPVRVPGVLGDGWAYGGIGPGWQWRGPWMHTGPGVLVPDAREAAAQLLGLGAPRSFDELHPRAMRGNHVFAATDDAAVLLDLGDGSVHELFPTPGLEHVVPHRWGGAVAFSHPIHGCIHYPDRPEVCHTQLWAVTAWDEEHGARRVALGTQPLQLHAVGPAGQLLVEGRLLDEPPPEVAEPREVEWRFVLLDGEGDIVRTFDGGDSVEGIGGAYFALLARFTTGEDGPTTELLRIDWTSGEERLLVSGETLEGWALDHSDRRVSALVFPRDADYPQIWSGVVD